MAKKSKKLPQDDECVIPGPVSPEALRRANLKKTNYEELAVTEYVEWQAPEEKVNHLEKIKTEVIFDARYDAWDVHTDKARYWVITNPTNLYSQELFPSLDYTLSFHIGLMMRVTASRERRVEEEPNRLTVPWRRWTQAAEALDQADEAEEFQAVGMRCRECLISLVKAVATDMMVPSGQERPKAADFVNWSELIANTIANGSSAERVRSYLKATAEAAWHLVNWLTHSSNAVRSDAAMALGATEHVINIFGNALIKYERGVPDRCPKCSSYKIRSIYRPDLDIDPSYVNTCMSCGWMDLSDVVLLTDE